MKFVANPAGIQELALVGAAGGGAPEIRQVVAGRLYELRSQIDVRFFYGVIQATRPGALVVRPDSPFVFRAPTTSISLTTVGAGDGFAWLIPLEDA